MNIAAELMNQKFQAQSKAPEKTVYNFRVIMKGHKPTPYPITIYPRKGETEMTAWERVKKLAELTYMNIVRIEFDNMVEF